MFEHVWNERWCAWIVAPPGRVPEPGDLERADLTFVWGFLMDPHFVQGVTGRPIPFAPAVLRGYRRERVVRDAVPGFRLVADPEGIVTGVVLIGVSESEASALDRFEQVPRAMVRKRVEVTVGDLLRRAHIYMTA